MGCKYLGIMKCPGGFLMKCITGILLQHPGQAKEIPLITFSWAMTMPLQEIRKRAVGRVKLHVSVAMSENLILRIRQRHLEGTQRT